MALFPSLPEVPHLGDVFAAFPHGTSPLFEYAEALLRGPSELSVGERELIAAYVSGLNACRFCHGSHRIYASVFGVDETVFEALVADVDGAPVDEKLKPILRYVRKLSTLPPRLTSADSQAVYAAGWSERALFDAIQICGLFNCMNRIVEGTGVTFDYAANPDAEAELRGRETHSYLAFARRIGAMAGEEQ